MRTQNPESRYLNLPCSTCQGSGMHDHNGCKTCNDTGRQPKKFPTTCHPDDLPNLIPEDDEWTYWDGHDGYASIYRAQARAHAAYLAQANHERNK